MQVCEVSVVFGRGAGLQSSQAPPGLPEGVGAGVSDARRSVPKTEPAGLTCKESH